jgi:hypothetical protein
MAVEDVKLSNSRVHLPPRRAFWRMEGKDAAIYFAANRPEWLGYAVCKALWLAEPDHAEARTGGHPAFSIDEEQECGAALLGSYKQLRQEGKPTPNKRPRDIWFSARETNKRPGDIWFPARETNKRPRDIWF